MHWGLLLKLLTFGHPESTEPGRQMLSPGVNWAAVCPHPSIAIDKAPGERIRGLDYVVKLIRMCSIAQMNATAASTTPFGLTLVYI